LVLGGVWLRLVTWSRASALDRELADGADPHAERRAEPACRPAALGEAQNSTRGGSQRCSRTRKRPSRAAHKNTSAEIKANQKLLLALADRLRDDEPLGMQGLAMTSLLVGDSSSPLYRRRARPLNAAAFEAHTALERNHPQHH
jgi:hypothetical protein